jgi:hypothetical protein
MWEKATGNKAVPGLVDAVESQIANPKIGKYSKTMGAAIGEPAENIARFTQGGKAGREARRIGSQSVKDRDNIIRNLSDMTDQADDIYNAAAEQMMGKMKIKNMGAIKTIKNEVAAAKEVTGLIDNSIAQIDEMITSGAYKGSAGGRLKAAKRSIERHQDDLNKALKAGGDDVGANIHGITDSLKRDLQKMRKSLRTAGATQEVLDVAKRLGDLQEGFRLHLENPALYGAVGEAQKKFNSIWSRVIGRNKLGRKLREQIGEEAWKPVFATNRGAMEKFVNDMGRAKNQTMEDFFLANLDDKLAFTKTVRETFDELPAGLSKQLDQADEIAKKIRSEYLKAHKTVALQNQLGDITQKASKLQGLLPMGAGAGIGYMLGGEEGMALGLGLSVFTNPGRMIQLRAALDRMSSRSEVGVVKAIKGYIKKATGKAKPAARGMLAPASLKILSDSNWGDKRTKDKNKYEAFNRRADELTSFLSNPEKTMERLKTNVGDVADVAPNVATAMMTKAVQSARYLYDRMPKSMSSDTLIAKKFKPAEIELARWERIAAVIDNPLNLMKSIQAGMVTIEEVHAVRDNYPQIYEKIVTRVQLSILFDVPVDATMEPEFLARMQVMNIPKPVGPPEGPTQPKSKVGSYEGLSIDKASLTATQQVEMNKIT